MASNSHSFRGHTRSELETLAQQAHTAIRIYYNEPVLDLKAPENFGILEKTVRDVRCVIALTQQGRAHYAPRVLHEAWRRRKLHSGKSLDDNSSITPWEFLTPQDRYGYALFCGTIWEILEGVLGYTTYRFPDGRVMKGLTLQTPEKLSDLDRYSKISDRVKLCTAIAQVTAIRLEVATGLVDHSRFPIPRKVMLNLTEAHYFKLVKVQDRLIACERFSKLLPYIDAAVTRKEPQSVNLVQEFHKLLYQSMKDKGVFVYGEKTGMVTEPGKFSSPFFVERFEDLCPECVLVLESMLDAFVATWATSVDRN